MPTLLRCISRSDKLMIYPLFLVVRVGVRAFSRPRKVRILEFLPPTRTFVLARVITYSCRVPRQEWGGDSRKRMSELGRLRFMNVSDDVIYCR